MVTRTQEALLVLLFSVSCLLVRGSLARGAGVEPEKGPSSQIIVMGIVYCDFCSNNSFSRHSYFLPGNLWIKPLSFRPGWEFPDDFSLCYPS